MSISRWYLCIVLATFGVSASFNALLPGVLKTLKSPPYCSSAWALPAQSPASCLTPAQLESISALTLFGSAEPCTTLGLPFMVLSVCSGIVCGVEQRFLIQPQILLPVVESSLKRIPRVSVSSDGICTKPLSQSHCTCCSLYLPLSPAGAILSSLSAEAFSILGEGPQLCCIPPLPLGLHPHFGEAHTLFRLAWCGNVFFFLSCLGRCIPE